MRCLPTANCPEIGKWKMSNRGTGGVVGGSDITFRRHRRAVINLGARLSSFIYTSSCLAILFLLCPTLNPSTAHKTRHLTHFPLLCQLTCAASVASWLSTHHELGGLPGKDHCNVWTNDG